MKPDDFRKLASAGLTTEQIAVVMEIMDADAEDRRANGRARWRKHQEKKRNANVSKREPTFTANSHDGVTRVEDKTSNSEIEPPVKTNTHAADLAAFRGALAGECEPEQLDTFVKLRKAKRGVLTGHSAHLFKGDAAKCGLTIAAAIDTCIRRNWITVTPEYFQGRRARAGPTVVPLKDNTANAAKRRLEAIENAERQQRTPNDHQQVAGLLPFHAERAG